VLCSGAFRASFGSVAAAGLAVEMKVDKAKEKMVLPMTMEWPRAKRIFFRGLLSKRGFYLMVR
jgi:hypothetical protein